MLKLICFLLLALGSSIDARPDRTQVAFERHLSTVQNRLNLIGNETFTQQMFARFRSDHPRRAHRLFNETQRFQVFQQRLTHVLQHDQQENQTFTTGLNQFSDWVPSELQILRGNKPPPSSVRSRFVIASLPTVKQTSSSKKTTPVPAATFDYTTRVSAVNTSTSILRPVRDQGQCGSCYAFAIIALVEAQYAFQYGQAVNMSDQQIVDCSSGDYGCTGGYFDTSFAYLNSSNWYVNTAGQYPYTAVAASNCSAKRSSALAVGNLVYRHVPSANASAMQQALIDYGPLWISIYVGSDCSGLPPSACPVAPSVATKIMNTFQSYTGGIYRADGCVTSADNNNHAMAIVGYGYDAKLKMNYWKLRNSWGDGWGEDGYVRIQRGVNMCNVESDVFFLAKPVA